MNNKFNNKAMGAIVATSILIVVVVIATLGFQNWFGGYQTTLSTKIESQPTNNNLRVDGIFGDTLYLYSGDNSQLSSLKIVDNSGNEMCSFSDYNSDMESLNNDSSLVGWWTLDDEDSIIRDHSGNENHGTLYGTTRLLLDFENNNETHVLDRTGYQNHGQLVGGVNCNVDGISGKGCEFDGESGYIEIANSKSLNISEELTLHAWIKINDDTTDDGFIDKTNSYRLETGWADYAQFFTIYFEGVGNGLNSYPEISLADNNWHNLVATYSLINNVAKLYLNGIIIDFKDVNDSILTNEDNLLIGLRRNNNGYLNGSIDEVAIYSKALTDDEVKELYESQKAKFMEFKDSKLGKSVEFDGIDIYIEVLNDETLRIVDNLSVMVFYTSKEQNARYPKLISKRHNNQFYFLGINYDDLYFGISNGTQSENRTTSAKSSYLDKAKLPSPIKRNLNSFALFNYIDSTQIGELYNNGFLSGSFLFDNHLPTSNASFYIGADYNNGINNFFNGKIDEVRIYNRTLTEDEIKDLYWYSIKNNQEGVNQLDISSCNLNKGETYNIVGFTNNQKVEGATIKR